MVLQLIVELGIKQTEQSHNSVSELWDCFFPNDFDGNTGLTN